MVSFASPNLTNSEVAVLACGSNSFLQETNNREVTASELISNFAFMTGGIFIDESNIVVF
ncbi:hypothetical protein D3C86_1726940 [compost metagenome]